MVVYDALSGTMTRWFTQFVRLLAVIGAFVEREPFVHAGMGFAAEPWPAPDDDPEAPPVLFVQNWSDDPTYVGHRPCAACAAGWQPHLETACGLLHGA